MNTNFLRFGVLRKISLIVPFVGFAGQAWACFEEPIDSSILECGVSLAEGVSISGSETQLSFTQRVLVLDRGSDFALVETVDGVQGEVNPDLLMVFERVGRDFLAPRLTVGEVNEAPEDDPNEAPEDDPQANLALKGIIANTLDRAERVSAADESVNNAISIRNAPWDAAEEVERFGMFSFFPVYGAYVDTDPTSVSVGERWFLIGFSGPNEMANIDDRLIGWVREADFQIWPQRQAIYPKSTAAKFGFADAELVTRKVNLDFVDERSSDQDFAVGKMPLLRNVGEAFQALASVERTGNGDATVASDRDDFRQRFWQFLERVDKRDILFVIDNTESMERYRAGVLEGIRSFAERVETTPDERISFALFGDEFRSSGQAEEWGSLNNRWGARLRAEMNLRPNGGFQFATSGFISVDDIPDQEGFTELFGGQFSDPLEDKPEAGLKALDLAITSTSWRDDAMRIVVYLGDDGEFLDQNPDLEAYGATRSSEIKAVGDAILAENIALLSINVAGSQIDGFNDGWIADVNLLSNYVESNENEGDQRALIFSPINAYGDDNAGVETTANAISDTLFAFFTVGSAFAGLSQEDLLTTDSAEVSIRLEEAVSALKAANLPSSTFEDDFLELGGVGSLDRVLDFLSTNDTSHIAYFNPGEMEVFIAMERFELRALQSSLANMCTNMADPSRFRRAFGGLAEDLTVAFLGERYDEIIDLPSLLRGEDNMTVSEFFERTTALPATFYSIFDSEPRRNVDQFIEFVRGADDLVREPIHKEICLSSRLMQGILDGEYTIRELFVYEGYDSGIKEPVWVPSVPRLKEFNWLWGPRRTDTATPTSVYFVPENAFPQASP